MQLSGQASPLLDDAQLATGLDQAGLLDGHGSMGRQQADQALVGLVEGRASLLVDQEEGADDVSLEDDGHPEERTHARMGLGPPREAGIAGHVERAVRAGIDQQRPEQPVGPGQGPDGVDELVAHPGGDERREAVALGIRGPEGGVAGPGQGPGGDHHALQHGVDGALAGHTQNGVAHRVQGRLGR